LGKGLREEGRVLSVREEVRERGEGEKGRREEKVWKREGGEEREG